jgi:hypothetical protein
MKFEEFNENWKKNIEAHKTLKIGDMVSFEGGRLGTSLGVINRMFFNTGRLYGHWRAEIKVDNFFGEIATVPLHLLTLAPQLPGVKKLKEKWEKDNEEIKSKLVEGDYVKYRGMRGGPKMCKIVRIYKSKNGGYSECRIKHLEGRKENIDTNLSRLSIMTTGESMLWMLENK